MCIPNLASGVRYLQILNRDRAGGIPFSLIICCMLYVATSSRKLEDKWMDVSGILVENYFVCFDCSIDSRKGMCGGMQEFVGVGLGR